MKRFLLATIMAVGASALATGGVAAAAVSHRAASTQFLNGSFEQPALSTGGVDFFNKGEKFPGWTVVGATGNVAVLGYKFTYDGYSFPAQSGKQNIDLTGSSNSRTGIAQKLSTQSGKSYTLSFYVGNVYGPAEGLGKTSTVNVLVNGTKILAATNSQGKGTKTLVWQKFSTTFKATSSSTTVSFINGDPRNDTANCLDSVTVTAGT